MAAIFWESRKRRFGDFFRNSGCFSCLMLAAVLPLIADDLKTALNTYLIDFSIGIVEVKNSLILQNYN